MDPARSGINFYAYCKGNPLNFVDPYGLCPAQNEATYICFDVEGYTTVGIKFGHVEIITYNPDEKIYTSFSHSHGTVYEASSEDWKKLIGKNIDIAFMINDGDSVNRAIDVARKNYKKQYSESDYSNNCITSVMTILKDAKYKFPYPKGGPSTLPRTPNNWLLAFWQNQYGYKLFGKQAHDWILENIYGERKDGK